MSRNPKSSSIPSEIRPSIFSMIETYGPKDKNLLRSGLLTPKQLGESLQRIFLLTLVFWFIAFGSALLIDQLTGFTRQFQVAGALWFPITILFFTFVAPKIFVRFNFKPTDLFGEYRRFSFERLCSGYTVIFGVLGFFSSFAFSEKSGILTPSKVDFYRTLFLIVSGFAIGPLLAMLHLFFFDNRNMNKLGRWIDEWHSRSTD